MNPNLYWKSNSQVALLLQNRNLLEELLAHTLGTPIPVTALFSWLKGMQTTASGWQADLSALDNGRLVATRYQPEPRAVLRVALDR